MRMTQGGGSPLLNTALPGYDNMPVHHVQCKRFINSTQAEQVTVTGTTYLLAALLVK